MKIIHDDAEERLARVQDLIEQLQREHEHLTRIVAQSRADRQQKEIERNDELAAKR